MAAEAQGGSVAGDLAPAIQSDPVYVHPGARSKLSVADAGRIRLRILDRDIGRIHIAVVPERIAQRAGGLNPLANAIDRELQARGALIVTTGGSFYVVTSYGPVEPTFQALRTAVTSRKARGLGAQLAAAVDGVAQQDPGPDGDVAGPPTGGAPGTPGSPGGFQSGENFLDDIGDASRIGGLIVAGAIALPLLLISGRLLLRWRRGRATRAEFQALDHRNANDQLVALGDGIRALDLDVSMPDANPQGRDEYERALGLYDRANQILSRDDASDVQLWEAKRALEEGHKRIEAARIRLAQPGDQGKSQGAPL